MRMSLIRVVVIGLVAPWSVAGCGGASSPGADPEAAKKAVEQSMREGGMPEEILRGEMPRDPSVLEQIAPGTTGTRKYPDGATPY